MPKSERLAGVQAAGKLTAMSAVAGLLVAGIALPVAGVVGAVARDTTKTFNSLPVPTLGQLPERSEILDSRGNLIAYIYPSGGGSRNNPIDRAPVRFNRIAPIMRNAIVAIEDARFWKHGAFDPRGTGRALVSDLEHNPVQGGSTLAQQYVKNALILTATNQKELHDANAQDTARKIRELRIAATVEHEMTRPQLLAAYLNVAYFENQAYGIQVAAERYFSTTARRLDLTQAAMLAGLVENPFLYDPVTHPGQALSRRNVVLQKMVQNGYITRKQYRAAKAARLGLHMHNSTLQSGCISASAQKEAFFCDYVLAAIRVDPAYAKARAALSGSGGLKIYTTLNPTDQRAAQHAVNFVEPAHNPAYNPNRNADTEVLIQPRTGDVRAIAVDRPYGNGPGHTTVDYAVNTRYDGGAGVQTGSSSKIFTLLTALKQNTPFGFTEKVVNPSTIGGYTNCKGQVLAPWVDLHNAEAPTQKPATYSLLTGTTQSINIFYAHLEQKVGLCNVVKTAVSLGMTRANGKSLFVGIGKPTSLSYQPPADDEPSFTLGSVDVSPMSMAAAYASVAAEGIYCKPIAIGKIVTATGSRLPVQSADCHRVYSAQVADAANYILQGVLQDGTASNRGIGIPAAAKTGTANSGFYAAFAGWTPRLTAYVSVFNPVDPTLPAGEMIGVGSCYREVSGGEACPGQMYGDNAPGATWQLTFLHLLASLGHKPFRAPTDPVFFSEGSGQVAATPPPSKHGPHGHTPPPHIPPPPPPHH